MSFYSVGGLVISAERPPESYKDFILTGEAPESFIRVTEADSDFEITECVSQNKTEHFRVYTLENGDTLFAANFDRMSMLVKKGGYDVIIRRYDGVSDDTVNLFFRLIVECAAIKNGRVSIHGACIEKDGTAFLFSGVSGVGKSTRARVWTGELGFSFISGDRPQIDCVNARACGIPWDGKDRIYTTRNVPLGAVCVIERGDGASLKRLQSEEARRLLLAQTFVPMWDNELTMNAYMNLMRLLKSVPVFTLRCGPGKEDAEKAYELLTGGIKNEA